MPDTKPSSNRETDSEQPSSLIHFQGLTLLGSLALMFSAIFFFVNQARTPSDQNWFRNPPSNIYVSSPIPVLSEENQQLSQIGQLATQPDSIPTGSFIVSVSRQKVADIDKIESILNSIPENAPVEIEFLESKSNKIKTSYVSSEALNDGYVYKIENVVLVIDVQPGGASDRAGMKTGDLIVQIDNRAFSDALDADAILKTVGPGETTTYDVLRDGEINRLYLTMATFGFNIFDLVLLLAGGLSLSVGIFISLKSPHIFGSRILGWASIFLGFSIMSAPFVFQGSSFLNVIFLNLRLMSEVLAAFFFTWSWYYFPKQRIGDTKSRWWILGTMVLVGILHFVASYSINSNLLTYLIMNGLVVLFSWGYFIRKSPDSEYKRIGRMVGFIMIEILAAQIIVLTFSPPSLQDSFGRFAPKFFEFFLPISLLYIIGRFRLLDIDITVRRRFQYWLTTFAWVLALFVVGVWLFWYIPTLNITLPVITLTGSNLEVLETADQAYIQTLERSFLMIVGVGLFMLFVRTARWGQGFINKKYHRSNYDYRDANRRLGEITSTNLTVDSLSERILTLVSELMMVRNVALIIRSEDDSTFMASFYRDGEIKDWDSSSGRFSQLFVALRNVVSEVRVENLPKTTRAFCTRENLTMAIPLWSKKRLYGILLLGEKLSDDAFDQEDVSFLNLVSHQCTIAFDNAFLYRRLATQERLEHELNLARVIQLNSLPQDKPKIKGLDISASSEPAFEVGGDYFDYLIDGDCKITTVVGDVSGKGTSAALYLSKVQGIIRTLHVYEKEPRGLLQKTNALLHREIEKKSFVTALVAKFDIEKRIASVVRAGHLPLYRFNADSLEVEEIQPPGMGMGITTPDRFDRILQQVDLPFRQGDIYLLISDGVTELKPPGGEEFGEHRVKEILSEIYSLSASKIRSHIVKELKIFNRGMVPNDDQTVVVVKIL